MKDPLRAAGGGSDLNFNKIAQAMTDPKLAVNPSYMSAISKMLPGLADVLKNTQAAGLLKAGVKTGVTADQLRQQQQQQQQQQKSR
jgi:hypothetical protein